MKAMGPFLIVAGVIVYALALVFVYCICSAASAAERFYGQMLDLDHPGNDEARRGSAGGLQGHTFDCDGSSGGWWPPGAENDHDIRRDRPVVDDHAASASSSGPSRRSSRT